MLRLLMEALAIRWWRRSPLSRRTGALTPWVGILLLRLVNRQPLLALLAFAGGLFLQRRAGRPV